MSDTSKTNQSSGSNPADDQYTAGTMEPDELGEGAAGGPPPADDRGLAIELFLSMRDFASIEWCKEHVGDKPAGTHVVVGRIAGMATNGEVRESGLKVRAGEKAPPPSFWAKGEFEGTSLLTGEVKTAPWLILPRAAGELLKQAFEQGAQSALLDLEIGLQATPKDKMIPYRWTVRAYGGQSEAQRVIAAIRSRQEARAQRQEAARIEHRPAVAMDTAKIKTTV